MITAPAPSDHRRRTVRADKKLTISDEDAVLVCESQTPPLWHDAITVLELAEYLGLHRSGIRSLTRTHLGMLVEAGYAPDANPVTYTRRAVLQLVALMQQRSPSQRVRELQAAIGITDAVVTAPRGRLGVPAAHVGRARGWLSRAQMLVAEVRDFDPVDVWERLEAADRYDLQAMVMTLAAVFPIDGVPDTGWLLELPASHRNPTVKPEHGLAVLVPQPESFERRGRMKLIRSVELTLDDADGELA